MVESADDYLRGFSWNKVKYRSDKSIAQLLDSLHKVSGAVFPQAGGICGVQYLGMLMASDRKSSL